MFTIDGNFHNNILYGVNKIVQKYPDTPLENRFQGTYPKGEQFGQVKENADILSLRKAAQAHREVRAFIQPMLKPGLEMNHLVNQLENKTKKLLNNQGINNGIGFFTLGSLTVITLVFLLIFTTVVLANLNELSGTDLICAE